MKHTVYYKFILGYILFGLLGILVINMWTSKATSDAITLDRAEVLRDSGYSILNEYADSDMAELITDPNFTKQLRLSSSVLKHTRIWIIDYTGRIVYDSSMTKINHIINNFDVTDFGNKYYMTGNFYNSFDTTVLSVIITPKITDFKSTYYMVIHQDIDAISESAASVLGIEYITLMIVFFLSTIIILIFTIVVFIPLKKISRASSEYAKGNLTYNGLDNFTTDDEIGRLGVSLKFMASELNNLEEDQKKFIANVSHDFRSPLTSIKGYIEAMKDGTIPPEMQNKYLDIVLFETDRLTKLTQSLLTLNAWDTKGNRLDMSEFSLYGLIKPILATFEGKCEKKHIIIDLTIGSKYYMVYADRGKIEQVIYNLLDNAIKFSHNDSTISINVTDMNEKVFVAIKDSGIGIPKDSLNKIWDRFYKTDLSRGKDKTGTGLGLSITREIIKAHNENINVISTEGVGTKFVFTLQKAK